MTPFPRPAAPTARGWGVTATAGGLLVAAWLLGSAELAGLAAAAGAAVAVAAVAVGRAPLSYRAERWLAPPRVGVGGPACARLRFTNAGSRATVGAVAVAVAVPVGGVGGDVDRDGGGCVVPPLGPGETAEADCPLPTGRRGVLDIGPLALSVGDPLGLVERRTTVCGPARLVVHPRLQTLRPLPGSCTQEARRGSSRPARAPRGDDFFALREYEVGDDLRRVHWRSTARTGDLMLRQDELWVGDVATVLLDTRAATHRRRSFERALEVAASVAASLIEAGRPVRFLTTAGLRLELDGDPGGGRRGREGGRWAALMEHLALVAADDGRPEQFALAVGSVRRHPSGPLVAVVAGAAPDELAALAALRARLGVVVIARCGDEAALPPPEPAASGAVLVPIPADGDFTGAWNEAVLACARRDVLPI